MTEFSAVPACIPRSLSSLTARKTKRPLNEIEKELILAAYRHVQSQKTLYIVIDEAHLLDMLILRKLRLLFERFPKKHNLVLLGHPELLFRLSLMCNEDIKSRISYSRQILPLQDGELTRSFMLN